MLCKNCGTDNYEGAKFCVGCGNALTQAPAEPVYQEETTPVTEVQAEETQQPVEVQEATTDSSFSKTVNSLEAGATDVINKATAFGKNYIEEAKKDNKKLLIPIAAVAVVLVVIITAALLFSNPFGNALDSFFEVASGEAKLKDVQALAPAEVWNYIEDEEDLTAKDLYEYYDAEMREEAAEELEEEYGNNIKISYKITKKKELSDKKLGEYRDELNDNYGIKKKDVKKAYKLTLDVTVKGSEDKETEEMDLLLIKVGNKWYVYEGEELVESMVYLYEE